MIWFITRKINNFGLQVVLEERSGKSLVAILGEQAKYYENQSSDCAKLFSGDSVEGGRVAKQFFAIALMEL